MENSNFDHINQGDLNAKPCDVCGQNHTDTTGICPRRSTEVDVLKNIKAAIDKFDQLIEEDDPPGLIAMTNDEARDLLGY